MGLWQRIADERLLLLLLFDFALVLALLTGCDVYSSFL